MPYVELDRRLSLLNGEAPETSGELNFLVTRAATLYVVAHGLEYRTINDVLGALDGASKEFYRRIAVPYENFKKARNGDVYTVLVNELERLGHE